MSYHNVLHDEGIGLDLENPIFLPRNVFLLGMREMVLGGSGTGTLQQKVMGHGPLTRYVKLQVAHAPGMPGTFSPAADYKGNR